MRVSAQELAILLQGEIVGDPAASVSKMAKIEEADTESMSFIANPKYEHYAATTNASILLVGKGFNPPAQARCTFIKVEDPYSALAILLERFGAQVAKTGIEQPSHLGEGSTHGNDFYLGAFAYVGNGVSIGNDVKIYPNAYIGDNVTIGDNCTINAGAKVYHDCVIGNNCIIHSGVVIGSDGFGFAPQKDGSYQKIKQTGNVVLEDNVEVGANTVIDRATMGSTIIRKGVKLDNLIQIAHNVEIGESTVVAAQAGISGSTKLGKHCMVGGQAGFVGHIEVADGSKINAQSGVSKSIKNKGESVTGSPAYDFREAYKHQVLIRKLPEIMERLAALEKTQKSH